MSPVRGVTNSGFSRRATGTGVDYPVMVTWLVSGLSSGVGAAALRAAKKPRTRAETKYFIAKVLRRGRYEL